MAEGTNGGFNSYSSGNCGRVGGEIVGDLVQWLFNVLSAYITKSTSSPLNLAQKQSKNGESSVAPIASTPLISNSIPSGCAVTVVRQKMTNDALFGTLSVDGKQIGYSMERIAVAISLGQYNAIMELSPHFGFPTPHLSVPNRTYIEIHPANTPSELLGCIAVGQTIDGDALDNSRVVFDALVNLLPATEPFLVVISSSIAS
jgi:uncharacterized protein DUF5675